MLTESMTISIMPTYWCKNECQYCYLGKMRQDKTQLSLDTLREMLFHELLPYLKEHEIDLTGIEVYGGDLSLLKPMYARHLVDYTNYLLHQYQPDKNTNLILGGNIPKWFNPKETTGAVSINLARMDFSDALRNWLEYDYLDAITVLYGIEAQFDAERMLDRYNGGKGYVTFMQYSPSVENPTYPNPIDLIQVYTTSLLNLLEEWYHNRDKYTFEISNYYYIKDCFEHMQNCNMSNNIFITPFGNYACVQFEPGTGLEYFRTCTTISSWVNQCLQDRLDHARICAMCPYFTQCPSDHNRVHNDEVMEKCTYRRLVEWYAGHRIEGMEV